MKNRFAAKFLTCLLSLSAWHLHAHAQTGSTETDLGTEGGYVGYTTSAMDTPGGGDIRKVRTYDLVCPTGSDRPGDGRLTVNVPAGMCISTGQGKLVPALNETCFPTQQVGEEQWVSLVELGQYECFSQGEMRIVQMEKRFREGYHVVGSEKDGVQKESSHGSDQAASKAGKKAGGFFSGCTDNPFLLCSMSRPPNEDPMSHCWDEVCD